MKLFPLNRELFIRKRFLFFPPQMMKSGKFQDLAECSQNQKLNLESPKNITLDRQTFYCVPVPAETAWVKQISFFLNVGS